jgi:hypothetical protein
MEITPDLRTAVICGVVQEHQVQRAQGEGSIRVLPGEKNDDRRVALAGQTAMAKKGFPITHSVYLRGGLDNDSNCKTGIINFP